MKGAEAKTEAKKMNRYPGLRPFVKDDSGLFFGRNTEVLQLVDSIKVNKTLVLFGKSGLGKSSLIHAGVTPKLIEAGFLPLTVRFLDQKQEPLAAIAAQVNSQLKKSNSLVAETGSDVVRLFKAWKSPQKPVLVFDQFEEFFYYATEKRERTISALASLLDQSFTVEVANEDATATPVEEKEEPEKKLAKIDVSPKMLFLIRSDRYNMMNELAEKIPGLFTNRFELKPLLKPKAEQSIVLPGQISRPNQPDFVFKVQTYRYSVEALQIILKSLSNKEEEIESSQLQILCQELEEIAEKDFENLPPAQRIIEPAHFKGESGIKEILNRFYWKQLTKLRTDAELGFSDEDIRFVRRLIENELVKGAKRVVQSEEAVREFLENIKPDVAKIGDKTKADAVIDKLLDLRLIREEESHRGKVYEISHDTLLESIMKLRDERVKQEREEKIKEQQALLKSEKKRADQNEKLRNKAKEAEQSAKKEQQDAIRARNTAKEKEREAKRALQKAEEAEAKAKRSLNVAKVGLVAVLMFAITVVVLLILSSKRKDQLNRVYGQVLLLNCTRAYEDENHALAFNLAMVADSVLGKNGKLLDSLVFKWDLREYSGEVTVSAGGSTVTCQYKNRMIQLFRITDTLRRNNKSLLVNSADDFKISDDGTTLAVLDTVSKQIRFYKLSTLANHGLDTTRIGAFAAPEKYDKHLRGAALLTQNYFAYPTFKNDSLCVHPLSSDPTLCLAYKYSSVIGDGYGNNHSIFLPSQSCKGRCLDEIAVKRDSLSLRPRAGNYFVETNSPLSLFYDEETKRVLKILPDSVPPLFKLSLDSSNFYVLKVNIYDSCYLVFGGLGSDPYNVPKDSLLYVQIPIGKDNQKDGLISLNRKAFGRREYDLGEVVHHAHELPRFVKNDTLMTILPDYRIRKQRIAGMDSTLFENRNVPPEYYFSANRNRIYVFDFGISGFIDLTPSPTFTKNYNSSIYAVYTIGGKDFFSSGRTLTGFYSGRPNTDYWKNFYEPLDDKSKKVYGIE